MVSDDFGRDEATSDVPELAMSPDWEVSVGPAEPGIPATVVLKLSKDGETVQHQLDAKTATLLSNALIVEAERAQFKAAYAK